MRFEWDEYKNHANIQNHEISFTEAKTVFYDEKARLIADPEHSNSEDRFIILGLSHKARLLVVIHTYKEQDELIRIISARKATKTKVNIILGKNTMKKEYDFSDSIKNPYTKKLKKQVTIRLENDTIEYFKRLASEVDIPYQVLINMYLRECAENNLKLDISWQKSRP
jgi:uncharacterized DUF497 family protein